LVERVYLRLEGWYYLFVIIFVIGGAVLRGVNVLVALAGLMSAALILHWQLVRRSLTGMTITRSVPGKLCAGDTLEVEVSIKRRGNRGGSWAMEFCDQLERVDPSDDEPVSEVKLLFPHVKGGGQLRQRYQCAISQRGVYRFSQARIASRYPLGLLEGSRFLDMPDRVVVYPRIGRLAPRWQELIEADQTGQTSARHRRGWNEGDFYALREWRNGDSRRWIHWRTSAKLGALAVRQFEQRRSCDVALVLDLHQPASPSNYQRAIVEATISFAATAVVDLCKRGGSWLGLIVASRAVGHWFGSASPLFAQELLEHLSVAAPSDVTRLSEAADQLNDRQRAGSRLIILSTRSRSEAVAALEPKARDGVRSRLLDRAVWLDGSNGEFDAWFSLDEVARK
jgi:uncharacterized protein (DUF58 family)